MRESACMQTKPCSVTEIGIRSPRLLIRLALLAALLVGSFATVPSTSFAATPNTEYEAVALKAPDLGTRARFGRLKVTGDIDGDGVNDLFASAQNLDVGGVRGAGRVYAISGRTRQVIYKIDSPEPQAGSPFGDFVSAFGDLNGDGVSELGVGAQSHSAGPDCGTPEPNACREAQGKAWVYDGKTGNLLYALDNPNPQGNTGNVSRFGQFIGQAGDLTGDRRTEIIVAAVRNDNPADCGSVKPVPAGCRVDEGEVFIFNGMTGALIRTLNFPAEDRYPDGGGTCPGSCGWFGGSVQSPGDVDGDGVPDQLIGAHSAAYYTGSGSPCGTPEPNGCFEASGRLYLFSGATGKLIRKIDNPFPQSATYFGFQDVAPQSPGDVNGDGHPDLYGMVSQEGQFQGEGFVFNGLTGALLYALHLPTAEKGSSFFAMTKTDYNRDGIPDLFAGDAASGTSPVDQNGGGYIYNGKDGSLLKALRLPEADRQVGVPGNYGPALGLNLGAPGDLNGDGEPDYVAGALFYDEDSTVDAGRIYFFLSKVPSSQPTPTPTLTTTTTTTPPAPSPGVSPTPKPPSPASPTRRRGVLSARVTPSADLRASFRFVTSGRLTLPSGIAKSIGCKGRVSVQVKQRAVTLSTRRVTLRKDCTYSVRVTFKNARRFRGVRSLKVTARFLGNPRVLRATAPARFARVRR